MISVVKIDANAIIPNTTLNKHNYVLRIISKIFQFIHNNIVLLFFRPSYDRHFYNLTGHVFSKEHASNEEALIHSLYSLVSTKSADLVDIKQKINELNKFYPKNGFCVLSQALIIAAKYNVSHDLKNFLQKEFDAVKSQAQNKSFIPTLCTEISSTQVSKFPTYWKVGVIGAGIIIGCGILYYSFPWEIFNRLSTCFIQNASSVVHNAIVLDAPAAIFPVASHPTGPISLSNISSVFFHQAGNTHTYNQSIFDVCSAQYVSALAINRTSSTYHGSFWPIVLSVGVLTFGSVAAIKHLFSKNSFRPKISRETPSTHFQIPKPSRPLIPPLSPANSDIRTKNCHVRQLGYRFNIMQKKGLLSEQSKEAIQSTIRGFQNRCDLTQAEKKRLEEIEEVIKKIKAMISLQKTSQPEFFKFCKENALQLKLRANQLFAPPIRPQSSSPFTTPKASSKKSLPSAPEKQKNFKLPDLTEITVNGDLTQIGNYIRRLSGFVDGYNTLPQKQIGLIKKYLLKLDEQLDRGLDYFNAYVKTNETWLNESLEEIKKIKDNQPSPIKKSFLYLCSTLSKKIHIIMLLRHLC